MLAARRLTTSVGLLLCACLAAAAGEPPAKPEAASVKAEAKPADEKPAEFKPPPGFRTKKRGELVMYCRKETPLGSRFQAEKCYDEAGIRALERTKLEQREMLERMRQCSQGGCPAG